MLTGSQEHSAARPTAGPSRSGGRPGSLRSRYARRSPGEPRAVGYLYIAPATIVFAVFVLVPFGQAIWYSLFDWDGLSRATWVGLHNYLSLFTDPTLRAPFGHALILLIFYSALPVSIGLLLAAILARQRVRGMTAFRTVLFLPQVLTMVVVALAWRWIYAPDGLVNRILGGLGLGSLAHAWLGDFHFALPAVGAIGTWVETGLCMVLLLAGCQRIPAELYEAARLDGAGAVREFFAVTLPGLRAELAVAATLTVVAGLRNFDLIYITTGGGPGEATAVPSYEVYHRAFEIGRVGSAAAIGVSLALLIFVLTVTVTRLVGGRQP